jgi:hypothetical protein
MEKETPKVYTDEYIQTMVDLYVELMMEYQGLTPEQLEKGLENVSSLWLDEIQYSDEWIKKHSK